jgi:hypothetical protein
MAALYAAYRMRLDDSPSAFFRKQAGAAIRPRLRSGRGSAFVATLPSLDGGISLWGGHMRTWSSHMRTMLTALMAVLLTVPASAQSGGQPGEKKHHKTEQQAKAPKKVDDKAYNDALSKIPASNDKPDPWRNMR